MLMVGYFEGIDSQRGIAWRCSDSLALREFLGLGLEDRAPDHSSLTIIRPTGRLLSGRCSALRSSIWARPCQLCPPGARPKRS
jgi:Transposase domain (DUF772)